MTDGYLVNVQFKDGKTSSFYATYDGEWYYFMQDRFYRIKVDGINVREQEYRNYLDNAWYPVKLMSSAQVIQFGNNYVDQADKRLQEQIDTVNQRINNLSEIVSGINQLVSDLTNKVNGNTAAIKNINNTINNVIIPELNNKVDASKYDDLCREFSTLVTHTVTADNLGKTINNMLKYLGCYDPTSPNKIFHLVYPYPAYQDKVPKLEIGNYDYSYTVELSNGQIISTRQSKQNLNPVTSGGRLAYFENTPEGEKWVLQ